MNAPPSPATGPLPILKIPLRFYGLSSNPHPSRKPEDVDKLDRYVDRLADALKAEIGKFKEKDTTNVSEELYRAVRTMPAALFRLPDECEVPTALFTILDEHIYYVYSAFTAQPKPDPNLALMLAGYPEYIYYILMSETSRLHDAQPVPGKLAQSVARQSVLGDQVAGRAFLRRRLQGAAQQPLPTEGTGRL